MAGQDLTTRQLGPQDQEIAQAGLALLNRTQGQGLFAPRYLLDRLGSPDGFIVGAFLGNELVGLASTELITRFEYYLPFDPDIARKLEGKRVASFNTASVVEHLQGTGIGRLLMEKRVAWVRGQNCDVGLGVSWMSGLAHTSRGTFIGAGFAALGEVADFYVKASTENPFDCPGCRLKPCRCSAILFMRDFR